MTDATQEGTKDTTTEPTPAPAPKRRGRPRTKTVHVDEGEQGINLPPEPKAEPKPRVKRPEGIRVLPVRGKSAADAETGDFVIAKGTDTPWEAGALRLVRGVKAVIGKKLDFTHAKNGQWLGQYQVVKAEPGRKYSVWQVQASS